MIKIAISGNIASGKSAVENILRKNKYLVIDSDKIAHDLMSSNQVMINKVKHLFLGFDVLDSQGNLSRDKIGKVVFYKQEMKSKLESIIHPLILKTIDDIVIANNSLPFIFVSLPLLFEVGWQDKFDKVLFVAADDNIRLERLIKRNNYSLEYAEKRIKSQTPQIDKIKNADFVVYNNSSFNELESAVCEIVAKLTRQ